MSAGPEDLDGATGYRPDFPYHDENLLMLGWYARRLEATLLARGARRVLSLGIGHRVVSRRLAGLRGRGVEAYTIVEGSAARIDELRADGTLGEAVEVVQAYFEDYVPPRAPDAVEMGFVLEHVADPAALVARYAGFLAPGGLLAIAVPNARALHRLVGHQLGQHVRPFRRAQVDRHPRIAGRNETQFGRALHRPVPAIHILAFPAGGFVTGAISGRVDVVRGPRGIGQFPVVDNVIQARIVYFIVIFQWRPN